MDPENLQFLLDVGRQMAETRELDPLLDSAMCLALSFVGAEYGYLVLLDKDDLVFRVGQDKNGNRLQAPQEQISRTIFDQVISCGKATITADAISSFDSSSVRNLQIRSVMCAPLISRGKILGAIYVENRSEGDIFDDEDLKLLEYFAAQAAVSIENAMLNDDLESRVDARTADLAQANERLNELAITDSLTGLYNRRHFLYLAEKELTRAIRYQRYLSVLILDLDYFKKINDQYGHLVGDQVLQAVALRVQEYMHEVDILGRIGGEEFAILMPETDLASAAQTAERLCQGINSQPIKTDHQPIPVTISLGVTSHYADQEIGIDTLLDQADKAMYNAKKEGRNRKAIFKEE